MRAVVQRVSRARVVVGGKEVAAIGRGLVVLLGVRVDDNEEIARGLGGKVAGLRLFEDEGGKMNLGLEDVGGEALCISQFTLYGSVRRGRRPSFDEAAPASVALPLYEAFCTAVEGAGVVCQRGAFGEHMQVELVNDGPVTLMVDSREMESLRRA